MTSRSDHEWNDDLGLMVSHCTKCDLVWHRSYTGPGYFVVGYKRGVAQQRSARRAPPPCPFTLPAEHAAQGKEQRP